MNIREIPRTNSIDKLLFLDKYVKKLGFDTKFLQYAWSIEPNYRFHNCYWKISATNPIGVILITAHWDTCFPSKENCLDNNASLYNLYKSSEKVRHPNYDIVFAYTDAEEPCISEINGAAKMVEAIDPDYHIDLELTASGDHILMQKFGDIDLPFTAVSMPANNSSLVWRSKSSTSKLKGTCCISLIGKQELKRELEIARILVNPRDRTKKTSFFYPDRWMCCHSDEDLFDTWLNLEEMDEFTTVLARNISQIKS